MRRRLAALEQGDFEKACVKLLHAEGMREVKVAKRSKEGPLMTARCREGNLELRYAVRVLKGSGSIERRHVQDLRRDLGHYGAHVGLLCSSGDARGDARGEATGGGALIFMWCGDALAEKFFDAKVGVKSQDLPVFELDEAFFARVHQDAQDARARREERARDRGLDEGRPSDSAGDDESRADERGADASSAPLDENSDSEGNDEGDDEGGPEDMEAAPTAPGGVAGAQGEGGAQGRRRRRRRRRRGGRGGVPGAPRADGQTAGAAGVPAPSGGGGEGGGAAPSAPAPAHDGPKEG
jgi:hypothetical protein